MYYQKRQQIKLKNVPLNCLFSENFRPEMRRAVPGDLCDIHTFCTNGSYCSAFGFCHCPEGYSEVYSLCVSSSKVRMPGEKCFSENDVCSGESWCREGKCQCLNGYEPFRGRCRQNYLQIGNETATNLAAGKLRKPNEQQIQYHWRRLVLIFYVENWLKLDSL